MRIVFLGSSRFGLRCLDEVRKKSLGEMTGVVTVPRKFSISYRPEGVSNVLHADVASYCTEHAIDHVQMTEGMNQTGLFDQVQLWKPQMFLVCGWYHMVPKKWRAFAPAYGMHASLLPDYSGGAPLVWAIINDEKKTGITLFEFDGGVDSGVIVAQKETRIDDHDDIASVYDRIEDLGVELLKLGLPKIAAGDSEFEVQDEGKRRIFPQRSPEDGSINWNCRSREIWNFVRAQTRPYPGAFTNVGVQKISIWSARVAESLGSDIEPGELRTIHNRVYVECGQGSIEIREASIDDQVVNDQAIVDAVGIGTVLGQ